MSTPLELMTDEEQEGARLLAEARVRDLRHLHVLVEEQHPELEVDYSTITRYWNGKVARMDFGIIAAIADTLGRTPAEVHSLFRKRRRPEPHRVTNRKGRTLREMLLLEAA